MAAGVARYNPDWTVQLLPVADGGEGTAEVLTAASGGSFIQARASDPLLRYVSCQYGISADGTTAFINLAEASGLQRLEPHEINAFRTSTIGTGKLLGSAPRNISSAFGPPVERTAASDDLVGGYTASD